jgi:hypothetical protein
MQEREGEGQGEGEGERERERERKKGREGALMDDCRAPPVNKRLVVHFVGPRPHGKYLCWGLRIVDAPS